MANALYFGDSLEVLRESIKDEFIDRVYLDPPFNSNAAYDVLVKSPKGHQSDAQIEAFDDTWRVSDRSYLRPAGVGQLRTYAPSTEKLPTCPH